MFYSRGYAPLPPAPRLVGEGGGGTATTPTATNSREQAATSTKERTRGTARTRAPRSSSAEPTSKESKKRPEEI